MSKEEPGTSTGSTLIAGLEPPAPTRFHKQSSTLERLKKCSIVEKFRGCLPDLSTRQWQLLAVFAVADFIAGIVYNIKGPFYPLEAEKKGISSSQYGFVFGIFDLTKVFICPIFGRYMSVIGPRRVFIMSMMLIAGCSVFFGILDKFDNSAIFLTLSLLTRVFEAVGSAGFSTSSFAIVACAFPTTVATTFASLETWFGLGLIAGPLIGGVFFEIGGYDAPFIITGLLLFVVAVVIMSTMPMPTGISDDSLENSTSCRKDEGFSVFSVLKIPGVMIAAFGVFAAASSTGFINATLEPHIRQFNLSPVEVGIVFVIYGTVYAVTVPIWGRMCDKVTQPKLITLAGGVVNFVAFLLIGPAPFFAMDSVLWVTCVGLVLHGLALGATFVSGFVLSLRYAIANGFPNNMATYGVVSGMWTSILSLGMFLGPVIGGILLDNVGFRWGSAFVLISMLILIVSIIFYLMQNGVHIRGSHSHADVPEAEQPLLINRDEGELAPNNIGSGGGSKSASYGSA